MRCRCPLCGTRAATLPTSGAPCGRKNASRTLTAARRGHALDVDALVHGNDLLASDAVPHQQIADGLGRRDEEIDLSILPSRERIALEVKVHSARLRPGAAMAWSSASTAPSTPSPRHADRARGRCRARRAEHARQLPGGLEVELVIGSQRHEFEAFRRPRRSSPFGWATSIARCPASRRPRTVSRTWFCPPRQVRRCRCEGKTWHGAQDARPTGSRLRRFALPAPRASRTSAARSTSSAARPSARSCPGGTLRAGRSCAGTRSSACTSDAQGARPAATLVELVGGDGRVAIDGVEMIGDVGVGIVQQLAAQMSRPGRSRAPTRARARASTARRAGRRAEAASRATSRWSGSTARDRWSPAAHGSRVAAGSDVQRSANLVAERHADALVGIEGQDPVVRREDAA